MGFDLCIFLYILSEQITNEENSEKVGDLIKSGVDCLKKFREGINLSNTQFKITFDEYLEMHEAIIKSLKMPFDYYQPELVFQNILRDFKDIN